MLEHQESQHPTYLRPTNQQLAYRRLRTHPLTRTQQEILRSNLWRKRWHQPSQTSQLWRHSLVFPALHAFTNEVFECHRNTFGIPLFEFMLELFSAMHFLFRGAVLFLVIAAVAFMHPATIIITVMHAGMLPESNHDRITLFHA